MLQWMLKWGGRILSTLFALSILSVIVFRFVPPPITMMQAVRAVEQYNEGKPISIKSKWVSLDEMPPELPLAVLLSEDQLFYEHWGFDFGSIEKAAASNRVSKTKRGASTLTQQVAKNLFLWSGRDWVRKGLESYFTLLLELVWSKERILEVYLNIAEMGDGFYGAEMASRTYFDKPALKLSRQQCALLAAILPAPRKWSAATPNGYVRTRAAWIVRAMKQKAAEDALDEEQAEQTAEEASIAGRKKKKLKKEEDTQTDTNPQESASVTIPVPMEPAPEPSAADSAAIEDGQ